MDNTALADLMASSAKDAVNISQEEFNTALDFSLESVKLVDALLVGYYAMHEDQAIQEEVAFTLAYAYGAYLGEVLRPMIDGEWIYDETNQYAPNVLLRGKIADSPLASLCYNKLMNDRSLSLPTYVERCLAEYQ